MVNRNAKNQGTLSSLFNEYFQVFLIGIMVVCLVLAYFLLLGPKLRATQLAIQANIDQQEQLYANQQKKLANLRAIAALYQKIDSADLQRFNMVLPDKYVPEKLFGELEEIASQGGWLLSEIDLLSAADSDKQLTVTDEEGNTIAVAPPVAADKNLGTVNLKLTFGAVDYAGFKNLLRLLENNLRLFDITEVNFSPAASSATIFLKTYYYQPSR
jgi:hypothetical protein